MEGAPASHDGDRLRLVALGGCLGAALALYAAFAIVVGSVPAGWEGYVGFSRASGSMFRAFSRLPAIGLGKAGFERAMALLLGGLWAAWGGGLIALRGVAPGGGRRRARAIVLAGGAAILVMVIVTVPPVLSGDLYRQAIYGHMVALHGLNPYSTPVAALAGDPLFSFANEPTATSFYGPVYTALSAVAAFVAPTSPVGSVIAWKTTAAAAAFGVVWLAAPVARALAAPDASDGLEAQLFLAWNPVVVIESAASAHIEPIMTLPALAGLLLLVRARPLRGFALLVVSTLTKWLTGLIALYAFVREVRGAPPERQLPTALRLAGVGALVVVVCYAPFASGLFHGGGLFELATHGTGYLGDKTAHAVPQWVWSALFAALVVAVAPFATRGDWARLVAAVAALLLVFILLVPPWLFAWYFVTPIALAAVLPRGRLGLALRAASVILGADVMLYYARLVPPR